MVNKVLYILGQLSDDDADWLGSIGSRIRLNPGETLIERGIQLDKLFFVLDGELQVLSPKQDEIALVGIGEILGELSLLDENPTSAKVVANTPVKILVVPHAMLFKRLSLNPEFATRFYKALAMLLALRMRATLSRFGAGDEPSAPLPGVPMRANGDEVAASRFERMVRQLWGIKPSASR